MSGTVYYNNNVTRIGTLGKISLPAIHYSLFVLTGL